MSAKSPTLGGICFLLAVTILYGIAFAFDSSTTEQAAARAVDLACRLLPVLGIVVLVLFLSQLLLRADWVRNNLGAQSGPRGWFLAALGGILAAGPVYPWYALLKELRNQGMRAGLVSVFLYTRAIKLPLLPLLIHYFGVAFSLILLGYLILFSLPAGVLLEWLLDTHTPVRSSDD